MSKVDADADVDVDIEELEARLYAQIHHEAPENLADIHLEACRRHDEQAEETVTTPRTMERIVTTTSVINRPGKTNLTRYWSNGVAANKNNTNNTTITITTNTANNTTTKTKLITTTTPATSDKQKMNDSIENKKNSQGNWAAQVNAYSAPSTEMAAPENKAPNFDKGYKNAVVTDTEAPTNSENPNVNNTDTIFRNISKRQKQKLGKSQDLRINPFAARVNLKGHQQKQQQQTYQKRFPPLPPNMLKSGPFAQQAQKLQKAMHIEAKKQKSKNAQTKKKQRNVIETIELESTDEDDEDNDVILLPFEPPQIIRVDDSSEEETVVLTKRRVKVGEKGLHAIEENAMDAADVKMINFAKPHMSSSVNDSGDRAPESSSRCASPSASVLSSDDFIVQSDRSRLLEDNCADDEDLVLLSADMDSLLNVPSCKNQENQLETEKRAGGDDQIGIREDSTSNEPASFIEPCIASTSFSRQNYRVEQTQFRALDVYESESDINDSVYTKGQRSCTIIRAIGSSSDESSGIGDIASVQKTKRLRKRRVSSSKRVESEVNDTGGSDSTNSEDCEKGGVNITDVPFIARGPAVERCKTKPSRKPTDSPRLRRASAGGVSVGNMSDNEFIATLNNLAQGGDDKNQASDDGSDMEINDVPTARDIVEDVLRRTSKTLVTAAGVVTERSISESERFPDDTSLQSIIVVGQSEVMTNAVPEDACDDLDKIFERIDKMEWHHQKDSKDDPVDDSDGSSEVEIVTNPVAPPAEQSQEIALRSGLSLYNIVYSRGGSAQGGIGWNEEMRRFYNNSWRGNNFTLHEVQHTMKRARHLWKIYTEDRFPKGRNAMSNLKCYNCCEFGHTRAKCKRPKKPMICYMCGESGHYEPRCPNTICLRCGNKTQVFTKSCNACIFQNHLICPVCKVRGHTINFCPDKWRRYHSTTLPNIYPDSRVKYTNRKMCCICGGSGHLPETCRSAGRALEYPVIVSDIKSHQKSYNDIFMKVHHKGIAVNLLYKPSEEIRFNMAEKTTPTDYYGRFLRAVGMGYMLKRKRKLSTMTPERHSKQARGMLQQYQPTAAYEQAKRAQDKVVCNAMQNAKAPDQVQEVSGSVNLDGDNDNTEIVIDLIDTDADQIAEPSEQRVKTDANTQPFSNECIVVEVNVADTDDAGATTNAEDNGGLGNNFKTPSEVHSQSHSSPVTVEKDTLPMDSDSNYSFSDHFEMASTSATATATGTINGNTMARERIAAAATESIKSPEEKILEERKKPRQMEPLPDYIPLTLTRGDNTEVDATTTDGIGDNVYLRAGISRCFISGAELTEERGSRGPSHLPDFPCEAKIYLTQFHSNYLLSPEGHAFLVDKSKACGLEARLDWTSVGHVLVIFGFQSSQDDFHSELLLKYRELTDQMIRKRLDSTKVPRRTDVLIRFLRDNITQLLTNLGNVNELQRRIKHLDKQNTKGGNKSADKARRSLNMILLGQAGVCDGKMHLDKLLLNLRTLINDYKSENLVPNSIRDEIDAHFRVIFTPYRHDNYPELIQTYNQLLMKNRIPKLNIDPILLGQRVLDTTLTNEQKERLGQPVTVSQQPKQNQQQQDSSPNSSTKNIVPNPLNPRNSKLLKRKEQTSVSQLISSSPPPPVLSMKMNETDSSPPPTPSMKISNRDQQQPQHIIHSNNDNSNTHTTKSKLGKQSLPSPPFANPEQKSTVSTSIKLNKRNLESAFQSLLTEGDGDDAIEAPPAPMTKGFVRAATSKGPSMFWSRESMKYLDECVKLAKSSEDLLQKLQRVQRKSHAGLLSYNDYRAVIKMYSSMLGK